MLLFKAPLIFLFNWFDERTLVHSVQNPVGLYAVYPHIIRTVCALQDSPPCCTSFCVARGAPPPLLLLLFSSFLLLLFSGEPKPRNQQQLQLYIWTTCEQTNVGGKRRYRCRAATVVCLGGVKASVANPEHTEARLCPPSHPRFTERGGCWMPCLLKRECQLITPKSISFWRVDSIKVIN